MSSISSDQRFDCSSQAGSGTGSRSGTKRALSEDLALNSACLAITGNSLEDIPCSACSKEFNRVKKCSSEYFDSVPSYYC